MIVWSRAPVLFKWGWLLFLVDKKMVCSTSFRLNKGLAKLHSLGVKYTPLFLNFFSGYTQLSSRGQFFKAKSNTEITRVLPSWFTGNSFWIRTWTWILTQLWLWGCYWTSLSFSNDVYLAELHNLNFTTWSQVSSLASQKNKDFFRKKWYVQSMTLPFVMSLNI